jgi:hypothetical protein
MNHAATTVISPKAMAECSDIGTEKNISACRYRYEYATPIT